jgi:hypothetical protein
MEAEWSDVIQAFARAEAEMVEGYRDGFDVDAPVASFNRSRSYRHGFRTGRSDRAGKPAWPTVDDGRRRAAEAMAIDAGAACPFPVA